MSEIEVGMQAKAVLEKPAFQTAVTAIKAEIIDNFGKTPLFKDGDQHRSKIWAQYNWVIELEGRLEKMLADSQLALKMHQRKEKLSSVN